MKQYIPELWQALRGIVSDLKRLVMRNYRRISKLIELHRWFHRKSQHYILGNWYEYTKSIKKRYRFIAGYPRAWARFMWLSRHEIRDA